MNDPENHAPTAGGPIVPDLEPRPITMEEYYAYGPERFELLEGYLFHGPRFPEARLRLLQLLLVNVGLTEAVRLAPEARWREAIRHVYHWS